MTTREEQPMDCARIEELLPWLLNRTLDAGERRSVEEHLESCASCRAAVEEARLAFAAHAAHPDPSALVDFASGPQPGLPADERAEIEAHLAGCPSCAEEVALVRESNMALAAAAEAHVGGGFEAGAVLPFSPRSAPDIHPVVHARWRRLALAAGLGCVALTGALLWQMRGAASLRGDRLAAEQRVSESEARSEREVAAARQAAAAAEERTRAIEAQAARTGAPELNSLVIELLPAALLTRDASAETVLLRLPQGAKRATLLLVPPPGFAGSRELTVELHDATKLVWSGQGLRLGPDGDFALSLPTALLAAGRYEIRLYAAGAASRDAVARYRLRVEPAP